MADYSIGSFLLPSTSANGEDEIVYFAEMPAGGEALCLRGPRTGNNNSAIKKQLDDQHQLESAISPENGSISPRNGSNC
jgi:hypothetical protein